MDQLLASLPKTFIAITAMVLTLFIIRQINPPRTICDAQMEFFRESQKSFVYQPEVKGNVTKVSRIKELVGQCKQDNSPGGCFELFESLKKMSGDLDSLSDQCADTVKDEKQVADWLRGSFKLMVLTAWGDKPPGSYMQKNGWFDSSEVTLFCNLRRHMIRVFGAEEFSNIQENLLKEVPQADHMIRDQVWPRSILSTSCDLYR